jgi:polyhydroxyalkanoate synthase
MHPEKVRNLVTMVTPVDFKTPDNMLSHWVQNIDIDLLVDTQGNIPGEMLNWTFLNLKPYQLMAQKYLGVVDLMDDPKALKSFMRMEKWIFDSPDQAGETFRQFAKDFFQENKLMKGQVQIGEYTVNLRDVTMPVLNVFAEQDHLVPPDASRAMKKCVGSKDYTELSFPGGHIGIYVSGKSQKTIPPAIGSWLNER